MRGGIRASQLAVAGGGLSLGPGRRWRRPLSIDDPGIVGAQGLGPTRNFTARRGSGHENPGAALGGIEIRERPLPARRHSNGEHEFDAVMKPDDVHSLVRLVRDAVFLYLNVARRQDDHWDETGDQQPCAHSMARGSVPVREPWDHIDLPTPPTSPGVGLPAPEGPEGLDGGLYGTPLIPRMNVFGVPSVGPSGVFASAIE